MRRADRGDCPPGAGDAPGSAADADADRERIRAAVYGAIDEVGRDAIAAELRGGAGAGAGGPIDRAVRIAAGRAGLPDPRRGAGLRGPAGGGADAGDADAAAIAVLTAFLHYMLSVASVPSQRKVRVRGEDIDVVVPDAAGLPAAVAVCVAGEAGWGGGAAAAPAAGAAAPAEARAGAVAAALGLPRERVWIAGWSRSGGAAAAADGAGGAEGAGRTYLASDGSFGSLVPDLAAFAASPGAVGGGAGGGEGGRGSRGRGRRLSLSGHAAGA